jgi:hypothetical protein
MVKPNFEQSTSRETPPRLPFAWISAAGVHADKRAFVVLAMALSLTIPVGGARAEEASVYGVQLPAVQGGGFRPAGTDLVCFGLDKDGRCWDGKAWHSLYPLGRRQYSSATGQVDCVVITKSTGDCWDGKKWYKLFWSTVSGVVLPAWQGGAFRTTPLPPDVQGERDRGLPPLAE